jgi:hypothetical protein
MDVLEVFMKGVVRVSVKIGLLIGMGIQKR